METELVALALSSVVSLSAGGLAIWGQIRSTRISADLRALELAEKRRLETERASTRYREPLARAAYDLQSRLYNILVKDFVGRYLARGDERERAYVLDSTTFLVAQYLAWSEIIRRDVLYIDLGRDKDTRELARLQDEIRGIFQADRWDRTLRLFAGEQRAIGERMIHEGARGTGCLGYAAFLAELAQVPDPVSAYLRKQIEHLETRLDDARPRLLALQHALVDLIEFLDRESIRFPETRRTKAKGTDIARAAS